MHSLSLLFTVGSYLLAGPWGAANALPQGTAASILVPFLAKEFEKIFGQPLSCCGSLENCHGFKNAEGNPNRFHACFRKYRIPIKGFIAPGAQEFSAEDVEIAKCLTNLHYRQTDVCISVQGSSCDNNGYTARGGRI
ncbi:hypothetical protein P152DRAFT_446084 [Eremomyces bilateralis CBS 781.70]|uniref:Uncharacterized protein n=1 Tax=Eremomyces bilateralis CBS 781.70 TaxID=1392243 RepID=A0A6G1GEE4_9PEZI|nr:uncharacterized protein P152DRAFT_446084 [Eremomyces bilateralis CBS 781.70]KAF1816428.1 hypothetical protein P152DRAFT_446084 [Eremomyces bilateralis CBS 781.70]